VVFVCVGVVVRVCGWVHINFLLPPPPRNTHTKNTHTQTHTDQDTRTDRPQHRDWRLHAPRPR
jgi:hypothetical protein